MSGFSSHALLCPSFCFSIISTYYRPTITNDTAAAVAAAAKATYPTWMSATNALST